MPAKRVERKSAETARQNQYESRLARRARRDERVERHPKGYRK